MKKLITIALVISLLCTLTACGLERKVDEDYAYVEITTSVGTSHLSMPFTATMQTMR